MTSRPWDPDQCGQDYLDYQAEVREAKRRAGDYDEGTCPACLRPDIQCRCQTWCGECRTYTNHDGPQHRAAQGEAPCTR